MSDHYQIVDGKWMGFTDDDNQGSDALTGTLMNEAIDDLEDKLRPIQGGSGDDFIEGIPSFSPHTGGVKKGLATLLGGAGDDTIQGGVIANTYPVDGAYDDWIEGEEGNDLLYGGGLPITEDIIGNSILESTTELSGNDTIQGGSGRDTIYAGGGDDLLYGGG